MEEYDTAPSVLPNAKASQSKSRKCRKGNTAFSFTRGPTRYMYPYGEMMVFSHKFDKNENDST